MSDARSPAYATLGRVNFVGAYLALLLPLAVGAALAASRERTRFAWWTLALLDAAGAAVTAARGAWLAAAAGALVLELLWTWPVVPRLIARMQGRGIAGRAPMLSPRCPTSSQMTVFPPNGDCSRRLCQHFHH